METARIKQVIDAMSEDERFFAAAYLKHLADRDDPERRLILGERMRRMDEGRKFTFDQARKLHRSLSDEGL